MLAQVWAWAHAQVLASEGAPLDVSALAASTGTARARLIAPRKLAADTKYIACIVPTTPGWTGTETSITLPVYYAWRFATGPSGDFASLVKRVKPLELDASVGHRTVDISSPGWGAPSAHGATVEAIGALRSDAWTLPAPSTAASDIGAAIEDALVAQASASAGQPPVLAPPSYGSAVTQVDVLAAAPAWQAALNQDVVLRMAASEGAEVIRADVDRFVDAAWRKAGGTEQINHALHLGELAGELAQRVGDKHLGSLSSDGELLALARPLATRMTIAANTTLSAAIKTSAMPRTALSVSLRRLGRPSGPLTRVSVTTATGDMLARINAKQITGDPPKTLATSAAGFNAVSRAAGTPMSLEQATPAAITSADTHWKIAAATPATSGVLVTSLARVAGADRIPTLPSRGAEIEVVDAFAAAARLHQHYITTHLQQISDTRPPLGDVTAVRPLGAIRTAITSQWTAARALLPILDGRVVGATITSFTPIAATPVLERPLIDFVARRSPDLLMPDVDSIVPNRLAVATATSEFVRAFLVGANEQLARELLWRRFPGALGHTWMQTF